MRVLNRYTPITHDTEHRQPETDSKSEKDTRKYIRNNMLTLPTILRLEPIELIFVKVIYKFMDRFLLIIIGGTTDTTIFDQ